MKIIKKGKLKAKELYTATCRCCGTEFEFNLGEAKMNFDQREGNFLSVDCPLAGCFNTVTVLV